MLRWRRPDRSEVRWQNGRRVPTIEELKARERTTWPVSSSPRPTISKRRANAQIQPQPCLAQAQALLQEPGAASSSTSTGPQVGPIAAGESCPLGSPKKALIASLVRAPFYLFATYPHQPTSTLQEPGAGKLQFRDTCRRRA